jgi:heme/copper-type cytochrome/quinol oxidase subunit 3
VFGYTAFMDHDRGSVLAGMAICWLLNVAQLGIGWLLLVADVRMFPGYYVLVGAVGVVQVGYVVPIWRLLRRKAKPRTAKGLLLAAALTAFLNIMIWLMIYTFPRFGTV